MVKQKKAKRLAEAKDILMSQDWLVSREKQAKYVTKEYQDYGLRLAHKLGDPTRKALYIKLAKNEDRRLMDKALSFTSDYYQAKNKAKIFMWKLKELKNERKEREMEQKEKQIPMF